MKQFRIEWKGMEDGRDTEGEILLPAHSRLAACFDAMYRLQSKGIEVVSLNTIEVVDSVDLVLEP
jgi:hypothetical protein